MVHKNDRKQFILKIILLLISLIVLATFICKRSQQSEEDIPTVLNNEKEDVKMVNENESLPEISEESIRPSLIRKIRVIIENDEYQGIYHNSSTLTSKNGFRMISQNEESVIEKKEINIKDYLKSTGEEAVFRDLEEEAIGVSVKRSQKKPSYKGDLRIKNTEEGYVIINELSVEEYLKAVLPSEMPSDYPQEALKAQAICARTYAYKAMMNPSYPEYDADINDSVDFQVYNNIKETESTNEAITQTKDLIMTYDNIPIDAFYYSTSCGVSTEADIWKEKEFKERPYLKSIPLCLGEGLDYTEYLTNEDTFKDYILNINDEDLEHEEPWYRWTYAQISPDMQIMKERIQKRWESNPDLILCWNPKTNTYESKEPELKGNLTNIIIAKRLNGGVADEMILVFDKTSVLIQSEYNIRYCLADGKTKVVRQDGSQVTMPNLVPSGFFIVSLKKNSKGAVKSFVLNGGGFGHGVGLSQNGAKNAAESGLSYQEILALFYSDITLDVIW